MKVLEYFGSGPTRVKSDRSRHLLIVVLTSFVSMGIIFTEAQMASAFRGIALFSEGAKFVFVTSTIGFVLGLAVPRSHGSFKIFLAVLCLLPCPLLPSIIKHEVEVDAERSRRLLFSELLEYPVPSTLSQFTAIPARITRERVYHFKISRRDTDSLLGENKFKPIASTSRPIDDFMCGSGPLSFGINDEVFVLEEEGGDVRTLRVNAGHTEGYIRSQHLIQTTTGPLDLNGL